MKNRWTKASCPLLASDKLIAGLSRARKPPSCFFLLLFHFLFFSRIAIPSVTIGEPRPRAAAIALKKRQGSRSSCHRVTRVSLALERASRAFNNQFMNERTTERRGESLGRLAGRLVRRRDAIVSLSRARRRIKKRNRKRERERGAISISILKSARELRVYLPIDGIIDRRSGQRN